MNCNFVKKFLIDYWEENLPTDIKQVIDSHLLTCEDCRRLVQTGKNIWKSLEDAPQYNVPNTFFHGIQNKLQNKTAKPAALQSRRSGFQHVWIPISTVTAVVFGLFIGTYFGNSLIQQTRPFTESATNKENEAGYWGFEQFNAYSDVEFLNSFHENYESLENH